MADHDAPCQGVRVRRAIVLSFLLGGLVSCAGVGDESSDGPQPSAVETLDTDGLEQELEHQIESQADTKVRMVDCPADVEQEQGRSFSCIAEDRSGATYTIVVTLRDDQGNLDWEITEGT